MNDIPAVEVQITDEDVANLRDMLMSPGYRTLLKLMDGKVEAMELAAQLLGRQDPDDPNITRNFRYAKAGRDFRNHVHAEVTRLVNRYHEPQNDSVGEAAEQAIERLLDPMNEPAAPQPSVWGIESKFRR